MTRPDSRPVRLARAALNAEVFGTSRRARDLVVRISDECGGSGLAAALAFWCQALVEHSYGGPPVGPVKLGFLQVDEQAEGQQQPPPEVLWGGRLVAAWAARDEETYDALIATMPTDGEQIGRHVLAVLNSAALALKHMPRGYVQARRP